MSLCTVAFLDQKGDDSYNTHRGIIFSIKNSSPHAKLSIGNTKILQVEVFGKYYYYYKLIL